MISSISASIYEEKKPEVDRKLNSARADSTDKYTLKLWAGPRGQLTDSTHALLICEWHLDVWQGSTNLCLYEFGIAMDAVV